MFNGQIMVNDDIQNGDDDHQIVHWPGARRREEEREGGPECSLVWSG